jgi:hypothetical protein
MISAIARLQDAETPLHSDARCGVTQSSRRPPPGRYREVRPESRIQKDPSPLRVKEVVLEGKRYIVCLNPRQARKDAQDRQSIVDSLQEKLKANPKGLIGNKGYRRYPRWRRRA